MVQTGANVYRIKHVDYGKIQLARVQFSDHGRYTVVASGVHSNSSVSFWLLVNGMETVTSHSHFSSKLQQRMVHETRHIQ